MNNLLNGNTLIFKVSEKGEIGNLNTNGNDITNFVADMTDVRTEVIQLIKNKLITFGKSIDPKQGSFVIVSEFSFNSVVFAAIFTEFCRNCGKSQMIVKFVCKYYFANSRKISENIAQFCLKIGMLDGCL